MVGNRTTHLDANRLVFIDEMNGHVGTDLLPRRDTLEIYVLYKGFERVTLQILEQHLLLFAVEIKRENRGKNRLLLQLLLQLVMHQFDHNRILVGTI